MTEPFWYLRYLFWTWWTLCHPTPQGVRALPSGWWQKIFIQLSNLIGIRMTARAVNDIRSGTAVLKVSLHLQTPLNNVFDSRSEVLERYARMPFSNNGTIFFICRSRTQITLHVAGCNEFTTMAPNAKSSRVGCCKVTEGRTFWTTTIETPWLAFISLVRVQKTCTKVSPKQRNLVWKELSQVRSYNICTFLGKISRQNITKHQNIDLR